MTKTEVAEALAELSKYLEMKGENRFKVGAYARAAEAISATSEDLDQLVETSSLTEIDGIGKGTAAVITELVTTGESSYLEELRNEFPPTLLEMAQLPGVGPKKAMRIHAELGVDSVEELTAAIEDGSLATVSGFGAKTVERVRSGIATWKRSQSKVLLPMALEVASALAEQVRDLDCVDRVEIAGQVRRRAEVVGRIDLVVSSRSPEKAMAEIAKTLPGQLVEGEDLVLTGTVKPSLETRICVTEPDLFVSRLFLETGSEAFLEALRESVARVEIDRRGVRSEGRVRKPKSERALLSLFGAPQIEPELRETAAVLARGIDPLGIVSRDDLRGTFHAHSTWSDGKASLEEMIRGAEALGLDYVGMSDHSKSAAYAGGLTEERIRMQHAELRRLEKSVTITVFRGTECDILADGSMDYDDATLASFDFVIASIHSRFSMDPDEMSDRIIRAISNPWVTFLGHLTGRKLLIRDGYSVEYDRIFDAAAQHGVVIEINGNPRRQDLDWKQMQNALDRGVTFSINPDAHSVAALGHVTTGVWNARRGLVPREAVLNTKSVEEIREFLEKRKEQAK